MIRYCHHCPWAWALTTLPRAAGAPRVEAAVRDAVKAHAPGAALQQECAQVGLQRLRRLLRAGPRQLAR